MAKTSTPNFGLVKSDGSEVVDVLELDANWDKVDQLAQKLAGPFAPSGYSGATAATRFVGGTVSGAPIAGTFAIGDFIISQNGSIYVCTAAGTPGTWVQAGGGGGAALATTAPTSVGPGASAVGTATTAARADHVHAQQDAVDPIGLTGATVATRWVGGTTSGAPTSGTFVVGDWIVTQNGFIFICTTAGTPGTWTGIGWQAGGAPPAISAASAGTASTWSRSDHTHAQQAAVTPGTITGATVASRYAGATSGGAPTSGTFAVGDFIVDVAVGDFYICTVAGTPGTWSNTFTAPYQQATGLTGATAASRWVGATASGAPTSGTFAVGDFIVDQGGRFWICFTAGSPGAWKVIPSFGQLTPSTIGTTSSVGTDSGAARTDHVHAQQSAITPGTLLTGVNANARFVGGSTSGNPSTGTFAVGDYVIDAATGAIRICTTAGSPGTWIAIYPGSTTTPNPIGTAAVGTAATAARGDHVHAQQGFVQPTGGTGTTSNARFVGGTASAAPTTGTFAQGDFVVTTGGHIYVCTVAGSPGTWVDAGAYGSGGGAAVGSATPLAIGTAAAGSSANASREDHVHPQQAAVTPTTITGATAASRYVGATTSGAPSTGTFAVGDFAIAQNAHIWVCTVAGSPGTWVDAGSWGSGGGAAVGSATPLAIGTAAVGTATNASREDHVHPQQAFVQPTGGTGTTNGARFVGATSGGAPATGTFAVGDFVVDQSGLIRICTTAGSPGTWLALYAGSGATPLAIGTASAGSATTVSRADHVHPQQSAITPGSALTGITLNAARFVGGTASVAPSTGTFAVGDFVIGQNGLMWICTTAGSPGTWTAAIAPLTSTTPSAIGTAAAGSAFSAARADHVHPQQAAVTPTTLTGATAASRYVGATTSGAPSTGTFAVGDFAIAQNAHIWVCTVAGTPGTWVDAGSYGTGASVGSTTPPAIAATGAAGSASTAARSDHTHAMMLPRVVAITVASNTYTINADITDIATISGATAAFTVANPTGTFYDGQKLQIRILSGTTGYIASWGTAFMSSGIAALPSTTLPASKKVTLGFIYDLAATKFVLMAIDGVGY